MNALTHFGPAVTQFNAIRGHDLEARIADFLQAVTNAAILDGASQSGILVLVEAILDRLQTLTQADPLTQHMTGGGYTAGGQDVVVAKLPVIKAGLDAEFIHQAFHGEI